MLGPLDKVELWSAGKETPDLRQREMKAQVRKQGIFSGLEQLEELDGSSLQAHPSYTVEGREICTVTSGAT